ncbi:hypothetical protein [Streptomyces malaysiensis]|uniref:Uncharacterized protein n=1 Tax=Streptomyces malaysiensis subsp. samsunensis TaxID=459658 RepID=A0A9X2M6Q5_STRMQ|nr:hypothetical protein [Streptomyces samsunensis]MCQ8835795.1 hypothetical protein [Streptomyces samsunensis]
MTQNRDFKSLARELAAREGISYTAARRRLLERPVPDPASGEWDDLVVSALSAAVAEHGVVLVREIWNEDARRTMVQRDNGVRWGLVEPAADGVVIREVGDCVGVVDKGTRVPVPRRLPDGQVEVAALWPVVWCSSREPFWRYVHNGWAVDQPGVFPSGLDPMCPSADLPYEVRVYYVPDGIPGETHTGDTPCWETDGWSASFDKAVLLAEAMVAHRLGAPKRQISGDCGALRAEVWQHVTSDLGTLPSLVHQVDAAPNRPVVPRLPYDTWPAGRPESTAPTPEPTWFQGEEHPPNYDLRVWSETDGWTTLAWIPGGRNPASIAATLLRVGTGGPYAFAETWGPRFPDAWKHDSTQEGRALMDLHPDEPYAERSARYDKARQREDADLAAALAERSGGALTTEQTAARLEAGGQPYRDFLRAGMICIMDALNDVRLAGESDERLRMRKALDDLEKHHQVEDWVIDLTREHMATNRRDAHYTDGAKRWRERALQEYLSPGGSATGVPGLTA